MNMFEEIDRDKAELPKVKTIVKQIDKTEFNGYQRFAVVTYFVCFFLGIIFGNLFPTCGSSSMLYGDVCVTTEFNFSLMLFIWFVSFLICLFFFALGHIIAILSSINDKLSKLS